MLCRATLPPQDPLVSVWQGVWNLAPQKWGQTRHLARLDAAGRITADGSGRWLMSQLGDRAGIAVVIYPEKKPGFTEARHNSEPGTLYYAVLPNSEPGTISGSLARHHFQTLHCPDLQRRQFKRDYLALGSQIPAPANADVPDAFQIQNPVAGF